MVHQMGVLRFWHQSHVVAEVGLLIHILPIASWTEEKTVNMADANPEIEGV